MVFRGKPSRACQRCRDRKLRCDLKRPSCSSCLRVGFQCTGYRDTDTLRINDQTQTVRSKALYKTSRNPIQHQNTLFDPSYLPLDLQVQARDLFYLYYVSDFSRTWDFLSPYFDPSIAPEHLTLSIDAVSLAFLSHQVHSASARDLGRRKYVAALQKTNMALQNPRSISKATMLEASLLLDLFEKITSPAAGLDDTHRAHVDGALALVKLRGLQKFTDSAGLSVLTRLSLNAIICCISHGERVPKEIEEIREHTEQFVNVADPKWKLNGLIIEITNLSFEMSDGKLFSRERVRRCVDRDKNLEEISQNVQPFWSYERVSLAGKGRKQMILGDYYDIYPDRMITQMWNVLRVMRILLCEEVVESSLGDQEESSALETQRATLVIATMVHEICASVPQMTDCDFAARHKLPTGFSSTPSLAHTHTLSHFLDTYILIFGLYVAAWSRNCPHKARTYIMSQLEHIAEHFGVKEAAAVVEILRRREKEVRVGPWNVYRLLGSYAFAA